MTIRYHVAVLKSLEHYVRTHRLVRPGERIGVAVSGGADSVALLRAFASLAPILGIVPVVLHLNHCLRGVESDADTDFVRDLASQLGLDSEIDSQEVASLASLLHLSLEAAGRRARYAFFLRAAANLHLDAVATAHTRDDQAETVLLRLLRGTGTSGLAGIHRTFDLSELSTEAPADASPADPTSSAPRLIRPLLATSRQQIERYLLSLHQPYRHDHSNTDLRFLRNRVRAELLPSLEREYNPSLRPALCETADIAAAENDYLESLVSAFLAQHGGALPIPAFRSQPLALQRRILRRLCRPHALALDFAHLDSLREFALAGRAARLNLPRGFAAEVLRPKNQSALLVLHPPASASPDAPAYSFTVPVPGRVAIGNLGRTSAMYICASLVDCQNPELAYNRDTLLSPARLGSSLVVRNLQPGDRIHCLHSGDERKITRLLQDLGVPASIRRYWPVLVADGHVVWVPGLPPAVHAASRPGETHAVMLQMCSEKDIASYGESVDREARTGHL